MPSTISKMFSEINLNETLYIYVSLVLSTFSKGLSPVYFSILPSNDLFYPRKIKQGALPPSHSMFLSRSRFQSAEKQVRALETCLPAWFALCLLLRAIMLTVFPAKTFSNAKFAIYILPTQFGEAGWHTCKDSYIEARIDQSRIDC